MKAGRFGSPFRCRAKPVASLVVLYTFIRKILLQRHLIWTFVVRDLRSRYVGSLMGLFWAVIHPFALLLSYTFVFSIVLQLRLATGPTDNFALFLFCGLLPWLYFQDTLLRSCTSVVDQRNLVQRTLFPSEILPITMALSNLVTYLLGTVILLLVLVYLGLLGRAAMLLPLTLLPLVLLSVGLGWLVAALQVFLRDTVQILTVVLTLGFWFTPVFYQIEMVPELLRGLIRVNPLTHVVEINRSLLLENSVPGVESWGILAGYSAVAILVGGVVFRATKREFVDVL